MSDHLSDEQWAALLRPINPKRVSTFKKSGKEFSHVESYEIKAHLIRVFGHLGFSADVIAMELVFETEKDNRWTVCYRAGLCLTVGQTTYTEWAVGDAQNQPSRADAHDLAVKVAESQALKRAAINLGDQFGLSLYRNGSTAPLVLRTLAWSPPAVEEDAPAEEAVDSHIVSPLPPENPEIPERETNSRQAPRNTLPQTPVEDVPGPDDLSDGTEIARATANADMVFNGTSPLDHIRNLMRFPNGMDPAMKLRVIRDAMAVATEHGLNDTRIPTGQSLSAYLTEQLQAASREIADLVKDA